MNELQRLPQSTAGRAGVHSIRALSALFNFTISRNVLAALGADHRLLILQRLRVVQSMASTTGASEFFHYRVSFKGEAAQRSVAHKD
jgi:hypothetical protein